MNSYDVAIIGGGPGGYVAAVRCSQLGLRTALVEKEHLGGTCLNWGCIPTKSLLRNAEVVHMLSRGRTFGFSFDNLTVDYAAAHKRSRSVVKRQTRRVQILLKNCGIDVYEGKASLKSEREINIEPTGESIHTAHIIIATGSESRALPGVNFDHKQIINFRRALNLNKVPGSAAIIGAGPIGMEFATLWNRYGCKVTLVEMMPFVLPLEDEEISLEAQKQFKRHRISLLTDTRVEGVSPKAEGVEVAVSSDGTSDTLEVETVLVSIGFVPNTSGLGLEAVGVSTSKGHIDVNQQMRSTNPSIYAIGDVTGKLGLAHVASAQGMIAAESIAAKHTQPLIYHNIPRCTYSDPEVASVGLTEQQAIEQGYEVKTAKSPFASNGKALAADDNFGFVKTIADKKDNKILGVHMIGGHVTELVAGAAGLVTLNATADDQGRTVHPHPTLSESLMEAAHDLCGHAIHI
ncbi:MAG: dihydrolipoyl dehydrogenase [Proteobacteria bacterium]|nr:dihydrolipoyl dehydrogenase [Pseudomonadota bacterium]